MIAEHSKHNKLSTYKFCDFKTVNNFITDVNFSKDELNEIKNLGVKLILV